MKTEEILDELIEKYGEWLEMAGDNAPNLLIEIMSKLLLQEREEKEFYKKVAYERIGSK